MHPDWASVVTPYLEVVADGCICLGPPHPEFGNDVCLQCALALALLLERVVYVSSAACSSERGDLAHL
jgi:hypothetical protein